MAGASREGGGCADAAACGVYVGLSTARRRGLEQQLANCACCLQPTAPTVLPTATLRACYEVAEGLEGDQIIFYAVVTLCNPIL